MDLLRAEDPSVYRKTCALYVALFHIGPTKYRSAYRKFVKALGDQQDWAGAAVEHLQVLDQVDLQEAARKLHDQKLSVPGR